MTTKREPARRGETSGVAAVGMEVTASMEPRQLVGDRPDVALVVATYGDPARLAFAERQANRLGLRAVVYRGHAALPEPVTSSAATVDSVGRVGLHTALEHVASSGVQVVLHVHDDVALVEAGLRALVDAHVATGDLVVPLVGEEGIDHGHAALPAAHHASEVLERCTSGDAGATREAVTVSTACVLGTPSQLAALLPFRIAFPGTVLNSVAADVRAVPGAVAAHDGAERTFSHLVEEDDGPLLVASMIVRDEEAYLDGCLQSLQGIVDRVDVCDTGSTDATLDILAAHGIEPVHRAWRDDFGWARNEVLELANDANWVLQVDADERLEVDDPALLRRVLRAATADFEALKVEVLDDGPGSTWASRWLSPRVFDPSVAHFVGAIHEEPRRRRDGSTPPTGALPTVRLRHLGYAHAVVADRDKQQRNLRISRTAWEADPSLEHTLHYARSHELADQPAHERVPMWEQILQQLEGRSPRHEAYAGGMLASALNASGDPARGRQVAATALAVVPRERIATAAHVHASLLLGEPAAVLELLDRATDVPSLEPIFDDDHTNARIALAHVAAMAALDHPGDAIRDVAVSAIGAGAAKVELWDVVLDIDDAAGRPRRTIELVVSTGSPMGFRCFAQRRATDDVFALTDAFLAAHANEAVRSFGLQLARLRGRDDLERRWSGPLTAEDRTAA